MATPIPVFPAAIATDAQLKVANNLITTTLQVGAASTDTILFVASTAGFVPNSLVSIESEIVAISSVVSSGNPQLIVASGGRGFDGTLAAAHSSGVKVSMFIDAWHHNAIATEIKAIEAFIGPNGQNLGTGYPFLVAAAYNFAPQSPGGSLVPGNNVITLSPVPQGVNGSDLNHYLYISGGTGVAESALITGGTAVSGQPSGTVIVNCANSHSGAWTIASATGGIQEAISFADPTNGAAVIVRNSITLHANVVTMGKHITVRKFAGSQFTNFGTFTIFGANVDGTSNDATWASDSITMSANSTTVSQNYPNYDTGAQIFRAISTSAAPTQLSTALWVQEDFLGTSGTPHTLRAMLNCPNDTNSYGVAAVAGYTYMGSASGTEGIGVHGECSTANANSSAVAVNAEAAFTGSTGTGALFGVVSNIGVASTAAASMYGVQVLMNPNPGNVLNPGGGLNVNAVNGPHAFGLRIYDSGGTFNNPVIIQSNQTNPNDILITNGNAATNSMPSSIAFARGTITSNAVTASVIANHLNGDYSRGILQLAVSQGSASPQTVLTVDYNQVATVAKSVRTTPIPVAQLPPSAANAGSWACVNDSSVTTPGSVVVGGGSNLVGVFCSIGGWKVVAF